MRRALHISEPAWVVLFEVDSLLIARQIQVLGSGKFACRSEALAPRLAECIHVGKDLDARGVRWLVRHIYREYNQTADALANQAIDLGTAAWAPPSF